MTQFTSDGHIAQGETDVENAFIKTVKTNGISLYIKNMKDTNGNTEKS